MRAIVQLEVEWGIHAGKEMNFWRGQRKEQIWWERGR